MPHTIVSLGKATANGRSRTTTPCGGLQEYKPGMCDAWSNVIIQTLQAL